MCHRPKEKYDEAINLSLSDSPLDFHHNGLHLYSYTRYPSTNKTKYFRLRLDELRETLD